MQTNQYTNARNSTRFVSELRLFVWVRLHLFDVKQLVQRQRLAKVAADIGRHQHEGAHVINVRNTSGRIQDGISVVVIVEEKTPMLRMVEGLKMKYQSLSSLI